MIERTFEIFKAGTHQGLIGYPITFSENDLKLTADTYNMGTRRAPLVLGHPRDDRPEYGLVKSLFAKAGNLYAHAQISPALLQLVREGRYKNRSTAFFGLYHKNNPHPGIWSIKHVGFLGAIAPAVMGMGALNFAADDGCICFSAECDLKYCAEEEDVYQFALPPDSHIDTLAMPVYQRANQYLRACPELSFIEAAVMAEQHINLQEMPCNTKC